MVKDEFDIRMSEYERYGQDWDAQKLHEFIRSNMTDVYGELQRAKVEISELEDEIDVMCMDVEALEKEVLEHENTIRQLEEDK